MRKPKCTEARPCQRTTCYACVRRLIDEMAAHMLPQQVDAFRYPAINALAHQIPAPAPKAPSKPKPTVDTATVQASLKTLRTCTTRTDARTYLMQHRVIELRAVAKAIDLGACSKLRKDELVEHLINFTVQMRLDHNAIMNAR